MVTVVAIGCSYRASQNGNNETNESTVESTTSVESDKSEQATTVNDSEIKSDATEKETNVENTTSKEAYSLTPSGSYTEVETELDEIGKMV